MMNLRQADMPSSRRSFLKGAVATAGTFVLGSFVPFGRFAAAEGEAAAPKAVFDPNGIMNPGKIFAV